jgi:deazaflavin-dependent oxidoreductase (nitroreductase family)
VNGKRYSLLHSIIQKIVSSRPGSWFFSHTLHHLDRIVLKLTRQRTTLTAILAGLPVIFLTTVGAKSGMRRTVPLVAITDERNPDTFAVIASNWGQSAHPAWYLNLKACPRAAGSISGRTVQYVAHEPSGEEYARFWQRAEETYIGYSLYKVRAGERHIPIMVMRPEQPQAADGK